MPIVFQQDINETTRLAVWHLQEPEQYFTNQLSEYKKINHAFRRLQHVSGRYLLERLLTEFHPIRIEYDSLGKPFSVDKEFHFSVSHGAEQIAVIVSSDLPVGIDLEPISNKPFRLKNKFLSEAEFDLLINEVKDADSAATLGWTIKEAVFKWYGLGQVDFKSHIQIQSIRITESGWEVLCLFSRETPMVLKIFAQKTGDAMLSYLMNE